MKGLRWGWVRQNPGPGYLLWFPPVRRLMNVVTKKRNPTLWYPRLLGTQKSDEKLFLILQMAYRKASVSLS